MYKKRLLNSAIALALATTGSAAFAVVNIDPPSSGQPTYANEPLETTNFPAGDGLVDDNATATIDLTGQLGWSVGAAGAPRFMRFDFFNAELESALAPGDLTLGIASGATFSVSISGGGQMGDDFVIFEVTNTDGADPINNTDTFTLDIERVIGTKDAAEVRYRAFETGLISQNATKTDPVDPSETFKDVQVNWFNWAVGLTVTCSFNPGEEGLIDTIDRAFWEVAPFTPAFTRQIASTTARGNSGILNPTNSAQVAFTDFFAPGNALFSVEGNFQGISTVTVDEDQDLGTPPAVSFPPNLPPASFAPNIARITYNGFFPPTPPGGFSNAGLYLTNTTDRDGDGQPDEMVPSGFDIRFEQPVPASNAADFRLNDVVRACGETVASGSSDRLDYTASPDGSGVNVSLFRIVNPSDTAGPVVMRVYNDDGASVEFPIDDIDGVDSDVLGANSSTPVIAVSAAYDVATTAGLPTPAPAANGAKRDKLRIEVRGAFGQESYDGNLNFNVIFDDSDGGFVAPGPSGSGLLRIRGEEQQQRSANGIQIQGLMLNDQNTLVPYNER